MSSDRAQNTIQAAFELGFLNASQRELVETESSKSEKPATEIAIRRGFLNRQQLDILNVFSSPLDVVPGYRVDGLIGQGGAGVVYRATQVRLDRPVAIKTIKSASLQNETASKRFEREARIVGQLRHPNIVSAFDFGVHAGHLYLVMEYIEGVNAQDYIDSEGKIPEDHAWQLALQVAHALDSANQHGIAHRDIKPANLLLTTPPSGAQLPPNVPFVKIADFGLARFTDNHGSPAITIEGAISGTPYYMSPEQILSSEVDHLSDIYSLGITLWHLITGLPPFGGEGPMDVITDKMKIEDEWLEQPPEEISSAGFQLLKRMCRHRREDRIDSYEQLVPAIESVILDLDVANEDESARQQNRFSAKTSVTFFGTRPGFGDKNEPDSDFLSEPDASATNSFEDESDSKAAAPNRWVAWALGTGMVLAVAWGWSGQFLNLQTAVMPSDSRSQSRIRLDSFVGPPRFLFNGSEVDPRQKFSGLWEPARGGEGESVLAGKNGTRDFVCVDETGNSLPWFQFNCGFRHHESDRIEFRCLDADLKETFRAVISTAQSSLVVDELEMAKLELEKFGAESFGYNLFQIESQPGYWRIMVNSKLLGQVDKPKHLDEPITIQLSVAGPGSGHFEQIQLLRFLDETDQANRETNRVSSMLN